MSNLQLHSLICPTGIREHRLGVFAGQLHCRTQISTKRRGTTCNSQLLSDSVPWSWAILVLAVWNLWICSFYFSAMTWCTPSQLSLHFVPLHVCNTKGYCSLSSLLSSRYHAQARNFLGHSFQNPPRDSEAESSMFHQRYLQLKVLPTSISDLWEKARVISWRRDRKGCHWWRMPKWLCFSPTLAPDCRTVWK